MSVWTTKLRGQAIECAAGRTIASKVAVGVAAALVLAAPLQAAEKQKSSKPENIGVASGLVIGAVAGGPIGAIVGAAGGAFLGERFHRKDVKNAELSANLQQSEVERARLVAGLQVAMSHGEELSAALDKTVGGTRDLEAAFAFRTNEATLSNDDVARLNKIGSLVGAIPNMKVRVAGYADPRGSEEYNAALSQKRAASVATILSNAGVSVDRIVIEAHGEQESTSMDGDLEGYAFERKVLVRIEDSLDGAGAEPAVAVVR
jgi:outer membrane protein OmpA-like peptidoglycan-associated protein